MTIRTLRTRSLRSAALSLTAIGVLSLAACGSDSSAQDEDTQPSPTSISAPASSDGGGASDGAAGGSSAEDADEEGDAAPEDIGDTGLAARAPQGSIALLTAGPVVPWDGAGEELTTIPQAVLEEQAAAVLEDGGITPSGELACEGDLEVGNVHPVRCQAGEDTFFVYAGSTGGADDNTQMGLVITDAELTPDLADLVTQRLALVTLTDDIDSVTGFYDPTVMGDGSARLQLMQETLDAGGNSAVTLQESALAQTDSADWLVGRGEQDGLPVIVYQTVVGSDDAVRVVTFIELDE